jgi:hypothetical protein
MCNAPKYGEVEERTGYGGGYNDRGVVEYIERQDSDDEYDEVISVRRCVSSVRTFLAYYIVQILSMKHNLSVRAQSTECQSVREEHSMECQSVKEEHRARNASR